MEARGSGDKADIFMSNDGIRITSPHFCAGLELDNGKNACKSKQKSKPVVGVNGDHYIVIRAAPIIRYMVGWTLERVEDYCKKKGWKIEWIT